MDGNGRVLGELRWIFEGFLGTSGEEDAFMVFWNIGNLFCGGWSVYFFLIIALAKERFMKIRK